MISPESQFNKIIETLSRGNEGKFFGTKSMVADHGKTAAYFWNDRVVFKLDIDGEEKALYHLCFNLSYKYFCLMDGR